MNRWHLHQITRSFEWCRSLCIVDKKDVFWLFVRIVQVYKAGSNYTRTMCSSPVLPGSFVQHQICNNSYTIPTPVWHPPAMTTWHPQLKCFPADASLQVGSGLSEYGQIQITVNSVNSKSSGNQTCISHVLNCMLNSKFTWMNSIYLVLLVRIDWDPLVLGFGRIPFH